MDISITLTLLSVFVTVGLGVWLAGERLVAQTSLTRRRIDALAKESESLVDVEKGKSGRGTLVPISPKDMTRLRRRLTAAGFHHSASVSGYLAAQMGLCAVMIAAPLFVMGTGRGLVLAGLGGVLGFMAPGLLLDRKIAQRKLKIENGLPDALDLLIVSLEAGLALDQAILKSGEELAIAHPELAQELRLINIECRAGKPRLEAFKNFANRTKVDDVRALVAMLVQTDRFGTSVAQALRTHAEVSRTKRRQRAEERAAKIGVKLVFPLVFCLFPAFYVVTLGPAIIKFIHAFGNGGFATGSKLP
ncbi:MAG TPA: type II secretion system F family protein [Vicinamibacterales bacterium]|nr:type II secretion system F family protein [Vicinamibacterales bacterium]